MWEEYMLPNDRVSPHRLCMHQIKDQFKTNKGDMKAEQHRLGGLQYILPTNS